MENNRIRLRLLAKKTLPPLLTVESGSEAMRFAVDEEDLLFILLGYFLVTQDTA